MIEKKIQAGSEPWQAENIDSDVTVYQTKMSHEEIMVVLFLLHIT